MHDGEVEQGIVSAVGNEQSAGDAGPETAQPRTVPAHFVLEQTPDDWIARRLRQLDACQQAREDFDPAAALHRAITRGRARRRH